MPEIKVSKSRKMSETIDEKTPKSKFKFLKKNFQEKNEENLKIFLKNSKNSDISMSNLHFSTRESKEVLRCATLTPSSGNLRGESAANGVLSQFLVFKDSDNNKPNIMRDNNGKMERSHGKRKLSQNITESIFEDHFSPKKYQNKLGLSWAKLS